MLNKLFHSYNPFLYKNVRLLTDIKQIKSINNQKPIRIFEVGPRDGLQNEKIFVDTINKKTLIEKIIDSGIKNIELTSFVSPKAIPQFSDSIELINLLHPIISNRNDLNLSVLVPNLKGMENAIKYGIKEVAIFTSASDSFNMKNINCNIDDSFKRFEPIMDLANKHNIRVRGYVSCKDLGSLILLR